MLGQVSLTFCEAAFIRRIERSPREKDLLRAALGKGKSLKILDATAGLCRDALRLAYWGHLVTACEREPAIFCEINAAYSEALEHSFFRPWLKRLQLFSGSTEEFLAHTSDGFDVIIIDPMFSDQGRTSLPQKDLQYLKTKAAPDEDPGELLQQCWNQCSRLGVRKILLKRPRKSPPIGPRAPTHSYMGRAHRWDVFVNP